jgi:hypothetical protein
MLIGLLVAAAAALLCWPANKQIANPFSKPAKPAGATYMDSVAALQLVRTRLIATDALGEDQSKAIDCLTLSLVGGSDK